MKPNATNGDLQPRGNPARLAGEADEERARPKQRLKRPRTQKSPASSGGAAESHGLHPGPEGAANPPLRDLAAAGPSVEDLLRCWEQQHGAQAAAAHVAPALAAANPAVLGPQGPPPPVRPGPSLKSR